MGIWCYSFFEGSQTNRRGALSNLLLRLSEQLVISHYISDYEQLVVSHNILMKSSWL
jgi:hypothetical protein